MSNIITHYVSNNINMLQMGLCFYATFPVFCRKYIWMGRKFKKIRHRASRAVDKTSKESKEKILKLYARLHQSDDNINKDPLDEYFKSTEGEIRLPAILAQLRSGSDDLVADALKKLESIADRRDIETAKILPLLYNISKTNDDSQVRYEVTKVISRMKDPSASDFLVNLIGIEQNEKVKEGAVRALGYIKAEDRFGFIVDILEDFWEESVKVRKSAAFALSRLNPQMAVGVLSDSLINDPDKEVRKEAAESISVCLLKLEMGHVESIARTIVTQLDSANETDQDVRISIINAVIVAEADYLIDELIHTLRNDPHPRVRGSAAHALSHFFDPRVESALIERLGVEEEGVKKRIALALANYAMKNPLRLHDEVCKALIHIQKIFPRGSYVWKEAVKALPAC